MEGTNQQGRLAFKRWAELDIILITMLIHSTECLKLQPPVEQRSERLSQTM